MPYDNQYFSVVPIKVAQAIKKANMTLALAFLRENQRLDLIF
jgi:hypothetical protein